MNHATAVKETLKLLIFSNILLSFQYSASLNKHPCPPMYCHHKTIPILRVQFCSIFVQQPSAFPHPSLSAQLKSPAHGSRSRQAGNMPVSSSSGEVGAFYLPQLLLSLSKRIICRLLLAILAIRLLLAIIGGKVTQAEVWSHELPQSIYRTISNMLPWSSAPGPSLCHASHFLVGYRVSVIPAIAPRWKGQLLHNYFPWQFCLEMLPSPSKNISGRYAAEHWRILTSTSQLIS